MSVGRPRVRFVPTLTEVVRLDDPAGELPPAMPSLVPPGSVPTPPFTSRSTLEAAVEALMPQAREEMRQRLHAAAYELAEAQLHAMEDTLRQQLRDAVRGAAGLGQKS